LLSRERPSVAVPVVLGRTTPAPPRRLARRRHHQRRVIPSVLPLNVVRFCGRAGRGPRTLV